MEDQFRRQIDVLDHGFARGVDFMGDDAAIVQAARCSYGKGTKSVNEDRGLIRYLMRNKHTSPLEMVEFKFHCKMPIFVARQWVRHRTANLNEMSGRYSEMPNEFYCIKEDEWRSQSNNNKQGSSGCIQSWDEVDYDPGEYTDPGTIFSTPGAWLTDIQQHLHEQIQDVYQARLELGVAREIARNELPLSQYTEWYWKIDLHNLFHFLRLRLHPHAQYEIRVYAEALYELIKPIVPLACEAFEDYVLHAVTFSRQEMEALMGHCVVNDCMLNTEIHNNSNIKMSKRELREFADKLNMPEWYLGKNRYVDDDQEKK